MNLNSRPLFSVMQATTYKSALPWPMELWGLLSPSKDKHFHIPQFCEKKKKIPFALLWEPLHNLTLQGTSGLFRCALPHPSLLHHNSPHFLLAAMLDHDVHVDGPNVCALGIAAESALKEGLQWQLLFSFDIYSLITSGLLSPMLKFLLTPS